MGRMVRKFFLVAGLVAAMGVFTFTAWAAFTFFVRTDDLPNARELDNYEFNLSSVVYGDDGLPIEKFSVEDRVFVPYADVPENVIEAVISAEDKNFFKKRFIPGIEITGILRAITNDIRAGKIVEGGSTITQQTAKLIWLSPEKSLSRKFQDMRLAHAMEKNLSREKIFEIYINLAYFGYGKYGIYTASEFYFGKKPAELRKNEAAVLAALIKSPGDYSPADKAEKLLARRNQILENMWRHGYLGQDEYRELVGTGLGTNLGFGNFHSRSPGLSEFVRSELKKNGYEALVNQGFAVHTTINRRFQEIAEKALQGGVGAYEERHKNRLVLYSLFSREQLKSLGENEKLDILNKFSSPTWPDVSEAIGLGSEVDGLVLDVSGDKAYAKIGVNRGVDIDAESFKRLVDYAGDISQLIKVGDVLRLKIVGVDSARKLVAEIVQPRVEAAVVILEVPSASVKAIVGSRSDDSKFNRATQAERQVGSTFKPFVYGAFFEKFPELDLNTPVMDIKTCYKTGNSQKPEWCPKNFEEKDLPPFMGEITAKTAIARSRNVAAVRVANKTGMRYVVSFAKSLGFSSKLPPYLPTAIGAADLKVIDLATAMSAFFRYGVYKPYSVLDRIVDKNGKINSLLPTAAESKMAPETADKILEALRWVVLAGTGRRAAEELDFAVAGKTGTTNNFTDAWFIGGTPRYLVAVWVGFDSKAISLMSRDTPTKETGGAVALPIFIEIMKEIYKDKEPDGFPERIEEKLSTFGRSATGGKSR